MKKNHKYFSRLVFDLAENNLGKTNNNPSVGCVVIKNNSIISSGFTSIGGRPHAEFNALNKKLDFKGSSMYLTLEPCTHYGLTPPCTNIIKKKKIKKVFYFYEDPDVRTNKKAKKTLKKIIVKKIKIKNNYFYESYFLNKIKNFPLIDAKIALSKDFFSINKKKKWITNFRSRQVTHLIRSKYDCIISTSETINKDNSLLNCRIKGLDNNKPDLIIIDRNLKLKKKLKLFNLLNKRRVFIFTSSTDTKKIAFFKKKNIKIIKINSLKNRGDFIKIFERIFKIGKRRVLVESGLKFLYEIFKFKLLNNLYLFQSNINFKKRGTNNASVDFIKRLNRNNNVKVNLNNDKLFKIRIK